MAPVIRVGVVGAAGRMGREVCQAVQEATDLVLAAAVDPRADELASLGEVVAGADVSTEIGVLADAAVEVAVDFTTADAARGTLGWCAAHGVHAVVGTTGLGPQDMAALRKTFAADGGGPNAVIAANFAIGAVLLMCFCELAAPFMDGVEVIELHHADKRDAPSGTSLRTAERIAAARERAGSGPLGPDRTTEAVLEGARGAEAAGGVRVHAVRLPGLVAHEEVVFGALGQALTVRHDSFDRRSFMPGVLLAIRSVGGRPGLTVGLEPLLGL